MRSTRSRTATTGSPSGSRDRRRGTRRRRSTARQAARPVCLQVSRSASMVDSGPNATRAAARGATNCAPRPALRLVAGVVAGVDRPPAVRAGHGHGGAAAPARSVRRVRRAEEQQRLLQQQAAGRPRMGHRPRRRIAAQPIDAVRPADHELRVERDPQMRIRAHGRRGCRGGRRCLIRRPAQTTRGRRRTGGDESQLQDSEPAHGHSTAAAERWFPTRGRPGAAGAASRREPCGSVGVQEAELPGRGHDRT